MAKQAVCLRCDEVCPRHCKSPGCGWVTCPTHGRIVLTTEQRKALGDA